MSTFRRRFFPGINGMLDILLLVSGDFFMGDVNLAK
jgi:hypothetical protein